MLRELGARAVPTCAALDTQPDGRTVVVVVETVARGAVHGDQEIADWVRDARRLATLEHPNVARIRDVVIRGDEVSVVGEFVDGVRWSELVASQPRVSLEIALRVLVDVLSGLSAVHNLRDAKREPLKLVHGELTPDCVVVGLDGVARIVGTCRVRSATARPGRDANAYLAPEVLLADETADARADVYSAGVMLWEALSGRSLFPNTQPSAIVTHLLSGKVTRATVPEGCAWAAPLADVAARALSADPEKRFLSAAALAADVRRIAGTKLAPPVRVAAFVRATFGDRVQARRAELERGQVRARVEVSGVIEPPPSAEPEIPVDVSPATISTAPTPIPPAPDAAPVRPGPAAGPPVVARVAPKPPGLPNMRPRQATLTGVAPPAPLPKKADVAEQAPVVAPPQEPPPRQEPPARPVIAPPTPLVAFVVPGAARPSVERIAADIATALEAPPVAAAPAFPPPAAPKAAPATQALRAPPAPPVVLPLPVGAPLTPSSTFAPSHDEPFPRPKPKRALLVALLAGPLLFGVAIVVWLMARPSPGATALAPPAPTVSATGAGATAVSETASTTTTAASAESSWPATTASAAGATTTTTTAIATAPPPSAVEAPPSAGNPPTTAAAAGTATAASRPTVTAPARTPPATYAPPPAVRPNKRKYEPEGI